MIKWTWIGWYGKDDPPLAFSCDMFKSARRLHSGTVWTGFGLADDTCYVIRKETDVTNIAVPGFPGKSKHIHSPVEPWRISIAGESWCAHAATPEAAMERCERMEREIKERTNKHASD